MQSATDRNEFLEFKISNMNNTLAKVKEIARDNSNYKGVKSIQKALDSILRASPTKSSTFSTSSAPANDKNMPDITVTGAVNDSITGRRYKYSMS